MPYFAKHSITGQIAEYPDHYKTHPVFSKVLIEVPKPTKGCDACGIPVEDESWTGQGVDLGNDNLGKDF